MSRVRWDPPVPGRDAERDTAIRPGTRIDRGLVRAAIDRLWRTRRFSRVQVLLEPDEAGSVEVVVETRPLFHATGLSVHGVSTLERTDIETLLGYRPDQEVWPEDAPDLEASIERGYAERGYRHAHAEIRFQGGDEPDHVVLDVSVREGQPLRVSRIRLTGELGLPRWRVEDALAFSPGQAWDQIRMRARLEAVLALYRSRGYRAASIDDPVAEDLPDGTVSVTIRVHAGERFEIAFVGNRSIEASVLETALALDDESTLDAPAIEDARKRLVRFYRLSGFLHVEITLAETHELRRREHVRIVTFRIVEGTQRRVVSLRFPGARHFTTEFLREQVWSYLEEEVPAPGVFQPVDSGAIDRLGVSGGVSKVEPRTRPRPPLRVVARTVFEAEAYAKAIEHVVELYKADGFLGIQVGTPQVHEREDRLAVRIEVREGVQTLVSEFAFEGNVTIASGELALLVDLPRGAPLSYRALEEARERLQERFQEEGLYYATVEPEVDFSETRERARVRYVVEEGPLVRITRVVVRGNERTSASLIRGRIAIEPGDPFRPSLARRSQERLAALGVFQAVRVEPEAKDLPEADKVLVVTVVERLPQYMELRGGFSTGQGARGGIEYRYRNLFGWAVSAHFRVELGYQIFFLDSQAQQNFESLPLVRQLERRISAGITVPHTPGVGDMTTALEVAAVRENERDFGYDKSSIILSFGTTAIRRLAPLLELGVERNDFEYFQGRDLQELLQLNPGFRRVLRAPEGRTSIGLVRPSVSYDLRDNPFAPSRGLFASLTTEYVRSFQEEVFPSNFIRVSTLLSGYVPLEDEVVVALSGRVGRAVHLEDGSQTYPDRRFYLGGFDTVRGFLEDTMIPEDLARAAKGDPELAALALPGGDAFFTARSELRFPLGLGFQGGIFFDAGNLWSDPANVFDDLAVRTSAGAGIRYVTPVGPLAFDYGLNLARRLWLDEPTGAFHFSIGVF